MRPKVPPSWAFFNKLSRQLRGESHVGAHILLPLGGEADPLRSRLGFVPGLSCVELCGLLGHSQLSDEVTSPCARSNLFKLDACDDVRVSWPTRTTSRFLMPARPTRYRC